MIDTVLFDLDNTLLDFDKAEANALTNALGDAGITVTDQSCTMEIIRTRENDKRKSKNPQIQAFISGI